MTQRTCPTCGKPKACAYARISDDQKGERLGISDQIEDCWARAGDEGWCVCTPDLDTFSDNDIGASKGKHRPGWEACLEAIRADVYGVLVARDDGRFTRRLTEFLSLIDLINSKGVQVVTLWTDRWDLTTAAGRKRVRDSASDAQYEAERLGERVSRARLRDAKLGKPSPGGQRAWGFAANRVDHVSEEVAAIRDVARRLLAGESLRSASLRHGKHPKDVKRALLAPRIIGVREYKGTPYPAVWNPILDSETWEAVKVILNAKNRGRVAGVSARKFLLSGFLFCGKCGSRCQGSQQTGTDPGRTKPRTRIRYICQPGSCTSRNAVLLETFVRDQVLARSDVRTVAPDLDPALMQAVQGYETRLAETHELWNDPDSILTKDRYSSQVREFEMRLAEAQSALDEAEQSRWKPVGTGSGEMVIDDESAGTWHHEVFEPYDDKLAWWEGADLLQRRKLIARYVERITLKTATSSNRFDPDAVEITWR